MALGRSKNGRAQRPPVAQQQADQPDHELDSYLAALAPEDSPETTGTGRRFGAAQVYQLRLPLMANEQLKELAARHGTSPAALARDWVIQRIAAETSESQAGPQPQAPQAQAPQPPAMPQRPSPPPAAQPPAPTPAWPQQEPPALQTQQGPPPAPGQETDNEITVPQSGYR